MDCPMADELRQALANQQKVTQGDELRLALERIDCLTKFVMAMDDRLVSLEAK